MHVFCATFLVLLCCGASSSSPPSTQPTTLPSTRVTAIETDLRRIIAGLQRQIADLRRENVELRKQLAAGKAREPLIPQSDLEKAAAAVATGASPDDVVRAMGRLPDRREFNSEGTGTMTWQATTGSGAVVSVRFYFEFSAMRGFTKKSDG